MKFLLSVAKAVFAGVIAFLGSVIAAVQDGSPTQAEWLTAVLVGLIAVATVWGIPWLPKPPKG